MEKYLQETIQHQWQIIKQILQHNNLFKLDSKVYRAAMGFEDELFNLPNSEQEESPADSPASPVQQVQSKIAQTIMLSCQELDICDQRTAALLAARVTVQLSDMH